MSSKLSIQNENKTYDSFQADFPDHLKKDLTKIICLKLPDAEIFRDNCLSSNKTEFKLTDILLNLNELSEKISVLDEKCQLKDQLFNLVHVLDEEIQNFARINSNWLDLEKYFQKVCFFKITQEVGDHLNIKDSNLNTDMDVLENLKRENKNLEIKLANAERDMLSLKKELAKQKGKNERTEVELEQQLTRNINISLEFKNKTTEIEKKLEILNQEYEKLLANVK
jgi:hypothetical protein